MIKAVLFFVAALACVVTMTAHGASKDVNGDGRTDASDIQLVVNASLGLPVDFDADINGDQRIDAADIQITIAIALGTTENLFPGQYSLKIFDQGTYGDLVGVGIFFVRGSAVTSQNQTPSALGFYLDYDEAVFEPLRQSDSSIVVVPSDRLRLWYQHVMWAGPPDASTLFIGTIGQVGISTFDDQIPTNPVDIHDAARHENPFLLGTIFLRKRQGATGQTELTISRISARDENAMDILNIGSEGGVFDLDASGL